MALPSRIKDDGIHVFDIGLPFILYGRYLGESKSWFAIQSFLPTGVSDSVIVARMEDLDAIEIDGDRLRAVREFAGPFSGRGKEESRSITCRLGQIGIAAWARTYRRG